MAHSTTFSDDEVKNIIAGLEEMGVNPQAGSSEDFVKWWSTQTATKVVTSQIRIVNFSGDAKSDSTYDLWRYEVSCLLMSDQPKDQIMNAIRRSLRGEAARVMMRLGPEVTVDSFLHKMDSVFGTVEEKEALLAEFYSAQQKDSESTAIWGCRLEDLLSKAAQYTTLSAEDSDHMLREMFWKGLRPELKDISGHRFDSTKTFDELRVALRKIEKEFNERRQIVKPVHAIVKDANKQLSTDVQELKAMVQQLTTEMSKIKGQQNQNIPETNWQKQNTRRDNQEYRGGGFRRHGAQPNNVCWNCGQCGHFARNCYAASNFQGSRMQGNSRTRSNRPFNNRRN